MKNKKENIIEYIYERSSLTKPQINDFLELFFAAVKNSVSQGADIELRGFGTFQLKKSKGYKNARNPKTNQKVGDIPPRIKCSFIPGQDLQKIVNQLPVEE